MIGKKEFLRIWYCCNLKKCWAEIFCQVILKNWKEWLDFCIYNIIQWVEIFSEGIFKFSICHWFSRNISPIFVVALLCKSRRIRKYEWSFRIHFNPLSLPNKRRLACAVECTIYSILCIVILFMGPIFGLGLHSTDQNPCIIRYKSTNWTVKGVHIINLFKIKSDSKWHILAL